MTNAERAKQFMPFSALKGFEDALKKAEFVPQEKRILSEESVAELNRKLGETVAGDVIEATYYADDRYETVTGPVIRMDLHEKAIWIGAIRIAFQDLYSMDEKNTTQKVKSKCLQ